MQQTALAAGCASPRTRLISLRAHAAASPSASWTEEQLARVAAAAPLPAGCRTLQVGCSGPLAPLLLRAGAATVLGVDERADVVQAAAAAQPPPGTVGNSPGARFWAGEVSVLPPYQGPFRAAYFLDGLRGEPRAALASAALLLSHGAHLVLARCGGRGELPDGAGLRAALSDLPLRLLSVTDEPGLYCAVLQVPPLFALPDGPLRLEAPVVPGFGRGSKQLGVPTANLCPASLGPCALAALRRGVYFGWASLAGEPTCKAVLNVGVRPTFAPPPGEGEPAETVEVHLMGRRAGGDFYGQTLRVLVLGFLRPEMRFEGPRQLLARIRTDAGAASALLDDPQLVSLRDSA